MVFGGPPPGPLLCAVGACFWVGVPPPLLPPWQLHALSAHNSLGGPLTLSLAPRMPHSGSAHCWVSSLSSGSLPSFPACFPVAPWPSFLLESPTSAGLTAVPVGASKPYLGRASAPCSGLAPSVPVVYLVGVPALPLSAAVPCCGSGGTAVLKPPIDSSLPPPSLCAPVAQVGGWWGRFRILPAPVHLSLVRPCPWLSLRGCRYHVATRLPHPLPDRTSVGFPPLRRPPPCPPLRGTCGPLQRPRCPRRRPALPSFCRPDFLACLWTSPFAPASPHGGIALPPCQRPHRGLSRC